jgi:hypothetical protein
MKPAGNKYETSQEGQRRSARPTALDEALTFYGQGFRESLHRLLYSLEQESLDYVVVGELALAAHGCRTCAPEITVCMREEDLARFWERLVGTVYENIEGRKQRFRDRHTQVPFTILLSGDLAGRRGKNAEIRFPDPSEAVEIEGLRTISLERLIVLSLVTWQFKGWADVIELIRIHRLAKEFAQKLPESVRPVYLDCCERMLEEDRYERELDQGSGEME